MKYEFHPNNYALAIPTTTTLNKFVLWHLRIGHINQQRLTQIQVMLKGIEPLLIKRKSPYAYLTNKESNTRKNFLNKVQDELLKY